MGIVILDLQHSGKPGNMGERGAGADLDGDGVIELHVYQRMLTAKGLELFFTATRDNIEIRSVRGRYRKQ